MSKQIIAISMGEAEPRLNRETIMNMFGIHGFELIDDDRGVLHNTTSNESFICTCFEQTNYLLFKEHEGELPEPVFQYILSLTDEKNTIVSLGDEDDERWDIVQTDSEYSLKRFRQAWLAE
jgi:hypothetical protein